MQFAKEYAGGLAFALISLQPLVVLVVVVVIAFATMLCWLGFAFHGFPPLPLVVDIAYNLPYAGDLLLR